MSLVGKRDRVGHYYSIKNGKVVQSLGKEEPQVMDGVTKRVNKNGVNVYEILNDFIAGRITELALQQPPKEHPDYKVQMAITMEGEGGVSALVRVPFDSAYGRGFLLSASGIDFDQSVELEPYSYTDRGGKSKMGLSVFQFGKQLPWTQGTKDNPGDVPKLEKTTFKGKEVWDNTKQLEYFEKFYQELSEKLSRNPKNMEVVEETAVDPDEDDDIDF